MPRLRMLVVGALAVAAAGVALTEPASAALPRCDGSTTVHNAPFDCAQRRTIDGTRFRVRLHVPVTGGVRVRFDLDQPRDGITDVHVQLHAGVDGPVSIDRAIQLSPDQTTATFHLGSPCVVDGVFGLSVQFDNSSVDNPIASPYVRRPPRSDCTS